jgi:hypothetical protein
MMNAWEGTRDFLLSDSEDVVVDLKPAEIAEVLGWLRPDESKQNDPGP